MAATAVTALAPMGYSASLFSDHAAAVIPVSAGTWTAPPVTVPLGKLHVGDRCIGVAVGVVTVTVPTNLSVSVTGGWLKNQEVSVVPGHIGPGQTATVYFTNAAVNGPQVINDTITVTGTPGGVVQTFQLTGEVLSPANPQVHDPIPLPPGCTHPGGKTKSEPGLVGTESVPVRDETPPAPEEAPSPAPAPEEAPLPDPEGA